MIKKIQCAFFCLIILISVNGEGLLFAQSIDKVVKAKREIDSTYIKVEERLNEIVDSAINIVPALIEKSKANNYEVGVGKGMYLMGKSELLSHYNYAPAADYFYRAQQIFEKNNQIVESAKCFMQLGLINYIQRNFNYSEECYSSAVNIFRLAGDTTRWRRCLYLRALDESEIGKFSEAGEDLNVVKNINLINAPDLAWSEYYFGRGILFSRQNKNDSAISNLLIAVQSMTPETNPEGSQLINGEIAQAYYNKGDVKNARRFAEKVLNDIKRLKTKHAIGFLQSHYILYKLDAAARHYEKATNHLSEYIIIKDSMSNERKTFELTNLKSKLDLAHAAKENKAEMAKQALFQQSLVQKQRSLKNLFIVGWFFLASMIAFLVYTNNLKKRKNKELADSLIKLRATQEQLIRQEKLASMGKLSAGIAHEIRNPINFITNFSELSEELLEELSATKDEKEKSEIMNSLSESMQKIKTYGKKAEAIVKNMLDHSRSLSPAKEATNIKQLCESHLLMALNAMRLQEPNFQCIIKKEYDEAVPEVKMVSADIGRVLLNIFNNSFHALYEKEQSLSSFVPTLTIVTRIENGFVKLIIHDNGTGIPDKIKNQIFEPFFTTKPTGQGTGLGLSISNEIVKMHNGELIVDSILGESTTFIISLPLS